MIKNAGKILGKLMGKAREKRVSPWDYERQIFENEARKQFLKLKEKGLPIPILTL